MTPQPKTQRFNALIETFDALTLFRFQDVHSIPTLLGIAMLELGHESVLVKHLHESALELGYGTPKPQSKK